MTEAARQAPGRRYLLLALAPLILVVLASLVTVSIAVRHADQPVVEPVSKQGLAITADNSLDRHAAELGISLILVCGSDGDTLVLDSEDPGMPWPDKLTLQFVHPADARLDHYFYLELDSGNRYRLPGAASAKFNSESPGNWLLTDLQNRWRVSFEALYCDSPLQSAGPGRAAGAP